MFCILLLSISPFLLQATPINPTITPSLEPQNNGLDNLFDIRFSDEGWQHVEFLGLENDVEESIEEQDSAFEDLDRGVILDFLEEFELERINEPKTESLVYSQSSHDLKSAAIAKPAVDEAYISGLPTNPRNLLKSDPSLPSIISGIRTVSMDEVKDERNFNYMFSGDDHNARKLYKGNDEDLLDVGFWEAGEKWLLAKFEVEKFDPVADELTSIISPVVEGSSMLDSFDLVSDINESNLKDPLLLNKDLTENDSSGTLFNHL
jgi:hypothetical protein